jgi:26S proteasome regulatory subunit N1
MAPKSNDKPVELTAETESKTTDNGKSKATDKKKSKKNDNPDIVEDDNAMSEEDRELKERLETCVSTLINEKSEASVTTQIRLKALDVIVTELRSATSSMTSVPKPLKFLRPKFQTLKDYYGTIVGDDNSTDKEVLFLRARLADVLAVLAMTLGKHGEILLLYLRLHCSISRYFFDSWLHAK